MASLAAIVGDTTELGNGGSDYPTITKSCTKIFQIKQA